MLNSKVEDLQFNHILEKRQNEELKRLIMNTHEFVKNLATTLNLRISEIEKSFSNFQFKYQQFASRLENVEESVKQEKIYEFLSQMLNSEIKPKLNDITKIINNILVNVNNNEKDRDMIRGKFLDAEDAIKNLQSLTSSIFTTIS